MTFPVCHESYWDWSGNVGVAMCWLDHWAKMHLFWSLLAPCAATHLCSPEMAWQSGRAAEDGEEEASGDAQK